jgi:hypothetical protein
MAPAIGRGIGQSFAPAYPHFVTRGLVALYDFVQGADSQVLYDTSGNSNDGQLGSTTGVDTNDPTWTSEGLSFDGVDDLADTGVFPGAGAWTLIHVGIPRTDYTVDDGRRLVGNNSSIPATSMMYLGPAGGVMAVKTGLWRTATGTAAFGTIDLSAPLGQGFFAAVAVTATGFAGVYDGPTKRADMDAGEAVTPPQLAWSNGTKSHADACLTAYYNVRLTDAEIAQNYRAAQHLMSLRGITI